MSLRSSSLQLSVNTCYTTTRHMQLACSHNRTHVIGFENRVQFRSAMLLTNRL